MKVLAGAEPEKKPDYRSQSLTELNKLEQKVILLNEMLDNVDTQRGEKFASGDVYDVSGELYCRLFFVVNLNYACLVWYSSKSAVFLSARVQKSRSGYLKQSQVILRCWVRPLSLTFYLCLSW